MPPFRGFRAQGEEGVCEGRHIIPDVDAVIGRLHDVRLGEESHGSVWAG